MRDRFCAKKAVFVEALEIADLEQRRQFLDRLCRRQPGVARTGREVIGPFAKCRRFLQVCVLPELVALMLPRSFPRPNRRWSLKSPRPSASARTSYSRSLGKAVTGWFIWRSRNSRFAAGVALKIIKLGMDTRNVIARFEAERQALAMMNHPNIARVLDAGATETGRPYFVMELVYGVKITDYCDQNCVSMKERLELFIQICNAVQHAHQKGIIHRDLKPSNIMVTMHDGVPFPKVIDFGIAKATEQRLTDKTLFTSYAQLMGTPAYMSPEQMELSGLNLDTRSDIYSLGVLLYELLTGRTPFDTTDLLKLGMDELRRTVREQEPLSPSAKLQTLNDEELTKTARRLHVEPPRLVSQLRGDLDWIVLKCLEKDRTRRYATANGLAEDIARYLHEEAVLARPPSRLYRLQKLVRRNRMVFLFGAAAVASLLLGTIISTMMFVKEREARTSEARLRREAEFRENASHLALLVTQRRFEEADKLSANLPLDMPSIEVSTGLRALGDWHAAHGRWPEAAARFESVRKVNQLDAADLLAEDQLKLAVALLQGEDRRGYEQFRQAEVARLSPANTASDFRTFTACLLLPLDTNMIRLFLPAAEAVEKRFPTAGEMRSRPPHWAEWSEVLALWEYRQGHFPQALTWGYSIEDNAVDDPARTAASSLIKAMSGWRLGQFQSARLDWTVACELIHAKAQPGLNIGGTAATMFPGAPQDLQGSWYNWVMADLLRRECDGVIAQSDQSLEATSKSSNFSPETVMILSRELGDWHAIRGEWEQARNRFSGLPEDGGTKVYFLTAIITLKLGDEAGFFRVRDQAISRFNGTTEAGGYENVMQAGLLRPLPIALPQRPWSPLPNSWSAPWPAPGRSRRERLCPPHGHFSVARPLRAQGAAITRRSLDCCQRSLVTCTYTAMPAATDRVIRAMCFSKLSDDASARSELDGAKSLAQRGLNIGHDKWNWPAWVFVRLLLQEADGLVPQAPLAAPKISHIRAQPSAGCGCP